MNIKVVSAVNLDGKLVVVDSAGRVWERVSIKDWKQIDLPEEPEPGSVEFHDDLE